MRFTGRLAALVVGVLLVSAGARSAPPSEAFMIPGYKTYKATLDVGGSIVATTHRDTTATCTPGQEITIDHEAGMEMGKSRPVTVGVSPYSGQTSEAKSTDDGEARHISSVVGYRETNYCDAPKAKLERPQCTRNVGRLRATIVGTSAKKSTAIPLLLTLVRDGGGNDFSGQGCTPPSISTATKDADVNLLPGTLTGMVLPTGITSRTLENLGRGKSVSRSIRVYGPCDRVVAKPGTTGTRVILPGIPACKVEGRVFFTLKRAK